MNNGPAVRLFSWPAGAQLSVNNSQIVVVFPELGQRLLTDGFSYRRDVLRRYFGQGSHFLSFLFFLLSLFDNVNDESRLANRVREI